MVITIFFLLYFISLFYLPTMSKNYAKLNLTSNFIIKLKQFEFNRLQEPILQTCDPNY